MQDNRDSIGSYKYTPGNGTKEGKEVDARRRTLGILWLNCWLGYEAVDISHFEKMAADVGVVQIA